jgi:hypothetical protein
MLPSLKRRNTIKISIILGTRPEIIKTPPIYRSGRSPFIVKAYRYNDDMAKELEIFLV